MVVMVMMEARQRHYHPEAMVMVVRELTRQRRQSIQ
jgi:uncharacterized short protein YbdD (DUF466 family)